MLRQYFPAFLETFDDLTTMGARTVLRLAATPAATAALRPSMVAAALRRGGRRRGVDAEAHRIVTGLRTPHLRHPQVVEAALGQQAPTYAKSLSTVAENVPPWRRH